MLLCTDTEASNSCPRVYGSRFVVGVPPPRSIGKQSVFSRQRDRLTARTAGEVSAKNVSPAPPSDHRFQEPVPAARAYNPRRAWPPPDAYGCLDFQAFEKVLEVDSQASAAGSNLGPLAAT